MSDVLIRTGAIPPGAGAGVSNDRRTGVSCPGVRRGAVRRSDRGQATVEWAILFPLVVMAALLVLQVALVGRERVLLVHQCRAAARVTAVRPELGEAQAAAEAAGGGKGVSIEFLGGVAPGQIATLLCTETVDTDVPVIGSLVPSVSFEERLSVYVEPE